MKVYNGKSVMAHELLAKHPTEDKFAEIIPCTARVYVDAAHFKSLYRGTKLPVPYLEILGVVDSMYLENPEAFFPCGTNEMQFMNNQGQDVRIKYFLTAQEMQDLIGKGLYEDGFAPPANLVGNVFEVPTSITYKGIYDTPICIVDINNPYEIDTATYDAEIDGQFVEGNGYLTFFESCKPFNISLDRVYGHETPAIPFERYKHVETNYAVQEREHTDDVKTVDRELSDVEIAEQKHISDVDAKIRDKAESDITRSTNVDTEEARRLASDALKSQDSKEEVDIYSNMFVVGDTAEQEKPTPRLTNSYAEFKKLAAEKLKREEDAEQSKRNAKKADLADGQLGDGVNKDDDPIVNDSNVDKVDDTTSPSQDKKKKAEKDYKKSKQAARAADLSDGQLGNGSSNPTNEKSKITKAGALLDDLLGPSLNSGHTGPNNKFL